MLSALAAKIWWQHYAGIISDAQISYMLERGYSAEALQLQMGAQSQRFLLAEKDDKPLAYGSYTLKTNGKISYCYLNKLYALESARGQGIGKALLGAVVAQARSCGLGLMRLNVNKHNPTVAWYLRQGFTLHSEQVLYIGFGFVMDDYVMELVF